MKFDKSTIFIIFKFLAEFANCSGYLIIIPFMAIYLGTDGYGVYAQIQAIIGFLVPIAMLGLGFAIVRAIAGSSEKSFISKYFQTTLFITLIVSCILAVCVIITAPILNSLFIKLSWATVVIQWSAILIVLTAVEKILNDFYRARLQIIANSLLQIVQAVFFTGGTIFILIRQGTLLDIILFSIVIKLFSVIALFFFFLYSECNIHDRWMQRAEIRDIIGFGVPIVITGISMWAILLGNRMIIGFFLNISEVGKYSAAVTLACVLVFIATPLWTILYPMVAAAYTDKKRDQLTSLCRKYMNLYLIIGIPSLCGLIIIGPVLLQIMGTQELSVNSLIFGVIALGLFSDQFAANAHYLLYLHNEPSFLRNITIICGILNISLSIILVPLIGILGAGLGTLLSYILLDLLTYRRVNQHGYSLHEIYDIPAIRNYLVSSGVMGIIIFLFFNQNDHTIFNLIWTIVFGIILYFTILWALSGFSVQNIFHTKDK